jgi:transposase
MRSVEDRVVIGMDPHKRSVTIEVMAGDETVLGGGRFATDRDGYQGLLRCAKQWPNRVWAIEGCSGIGRHVALRLLGDDEEVVDVPPKLSARTRVFATGQGRKTDATDAHSVALVGTRMAGLRPVVNDEQLAVLRILVDRRRSLGEDHTRMVSQLHQLLLELIPGGAKKDLSAAQAKALLAKVRPRDIAGKTRRRVAAELIGDLERIYQRKKAANKELKELVAATGTTLMDLHGIGPSGAARLLVEVGDITRFPTRGHFASWNGTAPIDASSGDQVRHRLSRAGNRQINRALHMMATVQLRNSTQGRAYYDRRKADGKTSMEAMRCVKRRLSDIVYRHMVNDAITHTVTGPGGQRGTATDSSATGSHPNAGTSEKPLPGPANSEATPAASAGPAPSSPRSRRPVTAPTRSRSQAQFA